MSDDGFKELTGREETPADDGRRDRVRDFAWEDLEVVAKAKAKGQREEDTIFTPLRSTEEFQDPWEKAKKRAAQLVADAEASAEGVRNKAHDDGYQAGQEEGRTLVAAKVEAALSNLQAVIKKLEHERAQIMAGVEGDLVAILGAALDRVLLTPGAIDPKVTVNVIRQCLTRVKEASAITINLSPADLESINNLKPDFNAGLDDLVTVRLRADKKLAPGDVVVDSNLAKVDATLATRRRIVEESLAEALLDGPGVDPPG